MRPNTRTPRLENWLNALWYGEGQPGLAARVVWLLVLLPLSWLFRFFVSLRRAAYRCGLLRSQRWSVPVIVVGNITVGGTGKTPLVIWLARQLQARGISVGIASRGYGAQPVAPLLLVEPNTAVSACGDEAALIARSGAWPVIVAAKRSAACQALVKRGVRAIICDDGLQHYAMARDLEIAVVDAARGLGNGQLLPAGPLRESASRLLSVQAVIYNGGMVDTARSAGSFVMQLQPALARNLQSGEQRRLEEFGGAGGLNGAGEVHAVAAIGNPQRFFAMLRGLGLRPIEHAFPDHHDFTTADLAFNDAVPVLMTAKDAVKCQQFDDARLWEVPVDVSFSEVDTQRLLALVSTVMPNARTAQ